MIDTTFWFSAPCFSIILLILLVIKRRWLRSPKVLDRSLYLLIFFTLVNCLAASLNVLYIRGLIGNNRLLLEAREITKSMSAVNFFFWLLFLLKYANIGRLPSSILLAIAGLLAAEKIVLVTFNLATNLNLSDKLAATSGQNTLSAQMIFENAIFLAAVLYSSCRLARGRRLRRREPNSKYTSMLVASLVPLLFNTIYFKNEFLYGLSIATSCIIWIIFREAYDQEILQRSKFLFLENMSHEIRTSLNSIYGFAQLLTMPEGTWSEEERQGFGVHMRNSYDMLDMLLNDLMVATRYDTHKYSVTVTDVDLAGVVTEAVNAIRVNMPSSVEVSLSSELPEKFSVKSDGRRIRQIMLNLLTNAYQHIISGTIEVHLRQVDKVAEISVTATFPSETDKAYEHEVEKSLEDHKEGLNLRLLLCIDIARLVNSEVRRDEDYDNGIRYLFEINDIIQHRSEGQKSAGSKRLEISSNSVTAKGIL